MYKYLLLFLMSFSSLQAQTYEWKTAVSINDEFYYTVPTSEPPANWKQTAYTPTNWSTGSSGFGYGDNDDYTEITNPSISVFMRRDFEIINTSDINRLVLDMDYDDGFVAYINGVEVARDLVSGTPVPYNQPTDGLHEARLYQGFDPERFFLETDMLVDGMNTLAIQVHNESLTSSDMTAIPVLSLEVTGEMYVYNDTPYWFDEPAAVTNPDPEPFYFESSNLPILFLETAGGQGIPDEPKIDATMDVIERPDGTRNYVSDRTTLAYQDFSGPIKIETRGSSSQAFSKKQYVLTTYNSIQEKENVKLLDMPKENDWILSGIAFDTTFVRDYVSYKLANKIGQYAARGRYCEVVLNDNYQGIYVLQEKLKADDNRIDINKIKDTDLTLPKLSGGYVTKTDKHNGNEGAWSMGSYGWGADFIHVHPKPEEVMSVQNSYIQNVLQSLANQSLAQNNSVVDGYPSLIDVPSFVDFMIMNELASNPDGYQFSTFFHKDRNGKLRAGPIWDFNLTYGNDLFFFFGPPGFDRSKTDVWQFSVGNRGAAFWTDLFYDPTFNCYLSKRWNELTQVGQPLHQDEIFDLVDETVALISEAVGRQEQVWRMDLQYETEISDLKTFVSQRIQWMTNQLGDFSSCDQVEVPSLVISKINYHPEVGIDEDSSDFEFIEITNNSNTDADLTGVYIGGTGLVYQFPNGYVLEGNNAVFLTNESASFESKYGQTSFEEFSRSLSNKAQEIVLLDGYGNLIDRVSYEDSLPWPEGADGGGSFLNLLDLSSDNNLASSWEAGSTLSVQQKSAENFLMLYPNPVTKFLNVHLANGKQIRSLAIWDAKGKQVKSCEVNQSSVQLDIEILPSGIYFITIETDETTLHKKILRK
jgi:hypothetical protein